MPSATLTVRRCIRRTLRYRLIAGQWTLTGREDRHELTGYPVVVVRFTETTYREVIGTRGEKAVCIYAVRGELRNSFLRSELPTAAVQSDDDGATVAIWHY